MVSAGQTRPKAFGAASPRPVGGSHRRGPFLWCHDSVESRPGKSPSSPSSTPRSRQRRVSSAATQPAVAPASRSSAMIANPGGPSRWTRSIGPGLALRPLIGRGPTPSQAGHRPPRPPRLLAGRLAQPRLRIAASRRCRAGRARTRRSSTIRVRLGAAGRVWAPPPASRPFPGPRTTDHSRTRSRCFGRRVAAIPLWLNDHVLIVTPGILSLVTRCRVQERLAACDRSLSAGQAEHSKVCRGACGCMAEHYPR
jgi:hypothetical protein